VLPSHRQNAARGPHPHEGQPVGGSAAEALNTLRPLPWAALALLATVAITLTCLHLHVLIPAHRAWLVAGWVCALIVLSRPERTAAAVLAAAIGAALGTWIYKGEAGAALMAGVGQTAAGLALAAVLRVVGTVDLRLPDVAATVRFVFGAALCSALAFAATTLLPWAEPAAVSAVTQPASGHGHGSHASMAQPHRADSKPPAMHMPAPAPQGHAQGAAAGHEAAGGQPHRANPASSALLGSLLGSLLLAPLLCAALSSPRQTLERMDRRQWILTSVGMAALLLTTLAIYTGFLEHRFGLRHTTLFVLPPAVMLALCAPLPFVLLGNLATVLIGDIGTSNGFGPFSDHTAGLPLLHLVFVGTTLFIAAGRSERIAANAQVEHMATHDALTRLPNRRDLLDRLGRSVAEARRHGQRIGVMFIDLDHFKRVNDTMGHDAGDAVLVQATQRMNRILRPECVLARIGGDEFVVLVRQISHGDTLEIIAKRLIDALSQPFQLARGAVDIGASIGLAEFPACGDSGDALLKCADLAMYRAKSSGRNQFSRYGPGGAKERPGRGTDRPDRYITALDR
jgi:diguanylate cyclase (GGDEF)-like protein